MKIITWNCNGALRKKYESIEVLDADICIVQECEDPEKSENERYKSWASNYLWIGDNKNKGIGVFAKLHIQLKQLNWSNSYEDHTVKYFLPCLINDEFQLLAIWAHGNNSPTFGYIGQVWKYLQCNFHLFDNILIAGDFNSNVIWDVWDRWWNHSNVLKILEKKKIESLYHKVTCEEQGEELKSTFYLQRKKQKAYHIDYFFGSTNFHYPESLTVGNYDDWIGISDHVPLILELKNYG